MYLFPYAEIGHGSKVIIYGAGFAGIDYYEQLKASGYAEVVCIVDQDYQIWNQSESIEVPVVGMEDISEYAAVCDYIVISIRKKEIAEKIKQELLELGIHEQTVLIPPDMKMHDYLALRQKKCPEKIKIVDFLNEQKKEHIIKTFFQHEKRDVECYFEYLILQLKGLDRNSKEVQSYIANIWQEKNPIFEILQIHILIYAGIINSELFRECIRAVSSLDNLELRYIYLTDAAVYPLYFPRCVYSEFYLELRESYAEMMEEFHLKIPEKRKVQKGRLVYLSFLMLRGDRNEDLIKGWTQMFEKEYEIYVFFDDISIQNHEETYFRSFCRCEEFGGMVVLNRERHRQVFGDNTHLEYISGTDIRQRQQNLLNRIFEISPEIIVDVTDERMPLSYFLVKYFPVLYIPMRGFRSSKFFTKIVEEGKRAALYADQKAPVIEEKQIIEYHMGVPITVPQRAWNRTEFGWGEHDFVIVTVSARLNYEMTEEFMREVCSWMREEKDVKWLLVGDKNVDYLKREEDLISNGKIYIAGYQTDLAGIYGCCDVYLNPLRTGGGVSQVIAVRNGVPVIADGTICFDAIESLGWDNACWSLEEQMEKLKRMKRDETYRQSELQKMQQALLENDRIAESDLLLKECRQMIWEWNNQLEEGGVSG